MRLALKNCELCHTHPETHDHLIFTCGYSFSGGSGGNIGELKAWKSSFDELGLMGISQLFAQEGKLVDIVELPMIWTQLI